MTATLSRIHLVSEGVLASYIHDITTRAATPAEAPKPAAQEESPCNPPS